MIRQLSARGILWTLENPRSSRMWITPVMLKTLRDVSGGIARTTFCRFGTPWMKPTNFAFGGGIRSMAPLESSCSGGVCSYRGRRHQVLEGKGPRGLNWTRIAQPYPPKMCQALVRLYRCALMNRGINAIDKL